MTIQECLNDVRKLASNPPDYESLDVLVVRTKISDAIASVFGTTSALYQVKLFQTFIDPGIDVNAVGMQTAFIRSLPLVEKGLAILVSEELQKYY